MPLEEKNIFQQIIGGLMKFFTLRTMKTFYWQTADAFLAILIVNLGGLDWVFAPILFSLLAILTKYINKNYLMSKKQEEAKE